MSENLLCNFLTAISEFLPAAFSAGMFAAITAEVFYRIHHRANMNVRFNGGGIYFSCTSDVDKCAAPYRLFFQVLIFNESPDPITIIEIKLKLEELSEELFVNDFVLPAKVYNMDTYFDGIENGKHVTKNDSFQIANPIKSGTVIRPYEAVNGVIFIMGCPKITSENVTGILTINTTRKKFEYNIVASRYRHEPQKYID